MALHITNPEVEMTVRAVAAKRGETITQTVALAVKELERRTVQKRHRKPTVAEAMAVLRSFNLEPINEHLTEDEILGYESELSAQNSNDPTVDEIMELVRGFNIRPIDPKMTEDEIFACGSDGLFA